MNLVYAKKTDEKVIEFHINDTVGERINGAYIESDMSFINLNKMADRINFRINTEGGSVLDGFKIISAILKSEIPVHTYNDSFAMSMGFFIWIAAKKENRHMASFATNMIHAARYIDEHGQVVEPENADEAVYLNVLNRMLAEITEQATGKSKEDVIELMSKDNFLSAEETMNLGLIKKNNIIKFKDMPQFTTEASIRDKMASIAAFYKNEESKINTMTDFKNVAAKLNLQAEASETSIVGAIDNLISSKIKAEKDLKAAQAKLDENEGVIEEKDNEIEGLNATVAAFEKKESELKETMAKAEFKKAVEKGLFKKDDSEVEAMAIKNPEIFSKLVAKAQVEKKVEGADIATKLTGNSISEMATKYSVAVGDMNYGDLWSKHPSVLAKMKMEDPKFIEKLESNWEE